MRRQGPWMQGFTVSGPGKLEQVADEGAHPVDLVITSAGLDHIVVVVGIESSMWPRTTVIGVHLS